MNATSLKPLIAMLVSTVLFSSYAQTPHDAARSADLETLRNYRFNGKNLYLPDAAGFIPYELAALNASPDNAKSQQQHVETMLWLKEYKPAQHRYGDATIKLIKAGLKSLGYTIKSTDGHLDPQTMSAIKAYQKDNNLAETGRPGPQWLGAFYQDIIKDVQYKLTRRGFNTYGTDGMMGKKTMSAIKAFRSQYMSQNTNYPYIDSTLVTALQGAQSTKTNKSQSRTEPVADSSDQNLGEDATKFIQAGLSALGYKVGRIDGEIGSKTINALKAFQKKTGITVDGSYNDSVKSALNEALLKDTQKKLNALGYNVGAADGMLGAKTIKALRRYRVSHNMTERGGITTEFLISLNKNYEQAKDAKQQLSDDSKTSYSTRYAQAGLRTLGHAISVDGVMGNQTQKTIKSFQKRYKLTQTGNLTAETLKKMQTIFLKESQRKLNALGYKTGTPDGEMGPKTKQALSQFKRKEGISSSGLDAKLIVAIDDAYDDRNEPQQTSSSRPQKTVSMPKTTSTKVTSYAGKRSTKGHMSYKRRSGRVVGCSISGRTIPIAWCEPFYPLPKNNYCEATFKPGSNTVVNLWCK